MQGSGKTNSAPGKLAPYASIAAAASGAIALGWLAVASAQDVPNGTLAAAIRASGHACARVIEKELASKGASVWRVRCNSGQFQVTMTDGSNPQVVRID
jgi:hypothetical protein